VTVAVAGDLMVDWQLASSVAPATSQPDPTWAWYGGAPFFQLSSMPLGAEPLGELLQRSLSGPHRPSGQVSDVVIIRQPLPADALTDPHYAGAARNFSLWGPMRGRGRDHTGEAWRINHVFGIAAATSPTPLSPAAPHEPPGVVALVDLEKGFRDQPDRWRHLLDGDARPDVILSASLPLGAGVLWDELAARHADRLTVVTDAGDLRHALLGVERPRSWEHVYGHILDAVAASPLRVARHIVITLDFLGAVVIERDGPSSLVFDPHLQADEGYRLGEGYVPGHPPVMVTALVRAALTGQDVIDGVLHGLTASRDLHINGYDVVGEAREERPVFPLDRCTGVLCGAAEDLTRVSLDAHQLATSSILLETLKGDALEAASRRVACEGAACLQGVPVETVGAWSSVDRLEIENLRSMRATLGEYVASFVAGRPVKRPLSVAVFGPPGAGKSFAVKQVAGGLLPGRLRVLEFNLSQLIDERGLTGAFDALRDAVLEQQLPLVFWDEFDTPLHGEPLGWLRHFLMPMQDGRFAHDGAVHPLGPAIFVFAGGTCATFAEFAADADTPTSRAAKKSDFISRLRGVMDVLGPNPAGPHDGGATLRRALLLHAVLRQSAPQLFRDGHAVIDEGVLNAFLHVPEYRHGARSLEAIVGMSALGGKAGFERASLPAPSQLAVHADADAFISLLTESTDPPVGA
jgi:hypothetical protein